MDKKEVKSKLAKIASILKEKYPISPDGKKLTYEIRIGSIVAWNHICVYHNLGLFKGKDYYLEYFVAKDDLDRGKISTDDRLEKSPIIQDLINLLVSEGFGKPSLAGCDNLNEWRRHSYYYASS